MARESKSRTGELSPAVVRCSPFTDRSWAGSLDAASSRLEIGRAFTARERACRLSARAPRGSFEAFPLDSTLLTTRHIDTSQRVPRRAKQRMQPTRQSPPFPFLRLPPQLRARVYTLLLTAPCPVTPVLLQQTTSYVTHYTPHGAPRWQPLDPLPRVPHSALAVAGTSRAVLAEALPAFYAANAFAFKSTPHLHAFLAALSPARLALLCSLHVALRGFRGRSARVCRVLGAACPGLRRLSVSVEGGGTADARAMLDALAESVRGLEVLDVGWRGRGVPGGGWPAFVEAVARQVTAPRIVVVPPSPSSAPAALPRPMRGVPEPAGVAREEGSWDTITWVYEADEMWRLRRV